jgi:hypothetical protein
MRPILTSQTKATERMVKRHKLYHSKASFAGHKTVVKAEADHERRQRRVVRKSG